MPSTLPTVSRRRLLVAGGTCLSIPIAGCTGERESGSTTVETFEGGDGSAFESTHEYETLSVRADGDDHFVHPSESAASDEDSSARPYRRSLLFVLDEDAAANLRIDLDDERAAEIRSFVEATDFDAESIVVDQRPIDDCYRRHVRGVRARDDSFRTRYCRSLKDPTTPCEADEEVMEAIVFRVRRAYAEAPSSRGRSESASCRDADAAREDGTATGRDAANASADGEADG